MQTAHAPVFHYTTGDRFQGIVAAGEIRPAFQNVEPPEVPAVWLSSAALWEHSATKGVIENGRRREATLDELVRICGCLVRVQVDPNRVALIGFSRLREELQIPRQTFARLLTAGRAMGSRPQLWRAVAAPVPASAFLRVEFAHETNPPRWLRL